MIKDKFKDTKGISLISLSIAVIILVVITNMLIYNVKDNLKSERLANMQTDISNLRDKILTYYAQNGKIPAKLKYINTENIDKIRATNILGANDTGDFYIIDLEALDNLTLNYGEDYKKISSGMTEEECSNYLDLYIINEKSLNIFYVEGIKSDKDPGEIFYTDYAKKDNEKVNLRYVDNVKIPEGYSYISGSINDVGNPITIQNDIDNSECYTWKTEIGDIETVIGNNTIMKDGETETDKGTFIESVNVYKGYYINNDGTKLICLGDIWTSTYDADGIYKDKNNNIVKIPAGFQVCMTPKKNTVDEGLVIRNATTDDRYVWIEVPKTFNVYRTAGLDIVASASGNFTDEEYTKIYNDLKTYTADYKSGSTGQTYSWTDTWYSGCGIADETEYNKLKNKMLKSIYQNGGFWIGQYEMGTDTARKSNDDELTTPVCKEGAYPYNYVTCAQAQERAGLLSTGNYTSSLMFGVQWDLVLKFIETKAINPGTSASNIKEALKTNSVDWGNYADATFEIQRGEYSADWGDTWKSFDVNTDGRVENNIKLANESVLLTTGATERNSLLNIYDFAGNDWEWTLEKTPWSNGPCTDRGGGFDNIGSEFAVSKRVGNKIDDNGSNVSFRSTLY